MTSVVKYDLIKEKTRAIKIVFQITILFSDTGAMFSKATQKHATPWNGFHALEKKKSHRGSYSCRGGHNEYCKIMTGCGTNGFLCQPSSREALSLSFSFSHVHSLEYRITLTGSLTSSSTFGQLLSLLTGVKMTPGLGLMDETNGDSWCKRYQLGRAVKGNACSTRESPLS